MNRWILLTICFVPLVLSILLTIPGIWWGSEEWETPTVISEQLRFLPDSVFDFSACSYKFKSILKVSLFNAQIEIKGNEGCYFKTEVDYFTKGGLCDPDGEYNVTEAFECCENNTTLVVLTFLIIFCMVLCTIAAFYYAFWKKTKKILYGISIFLAIGGLLLITIEIISDNNSKYCTTFGEGETGGAIGVIFFIFTTLSALILPIYTYFYYDKVSSKSTSTTYNINSLLF